MLAARDLGADVAFVVHDWNQPEHSSPEFLALQKPTSEVAERPLSVVYFLPFAFTRPEFRSKVTVGMTMFETDAIPPFWVGPCNATDGLIVPSQHCADAFERGGVKVPIKVAPLGVDTAFYTPEREKGYGAEFWFLMAGLLHYRKGVEYAIRAFREEFDRDEPVRLWLKTRNGHLDTGGESVDDPRISVIDQDYTRDQMRQTYRDADCFIACSRGEASGLTPREAMACGTPVILTDWGGLHELADPDHCYVTGIDGLEPAPLECSSYSAGVAGRQPIGSFCVPSVSELRAAMRKAASDRTANGAMGTRAAIAMDRWSWPRCASKWLAAISELWEKASK